MALTTKRSRRPFLALALITTIPLALAPVPALATTSNRSDPSDAPVGPEGKTDLRSIAWNIGATTSTVTIAVDDSTGAGARATLGVHLLVDNDLDGIADVELLGARSADGVSVDTTLRSLDRTLSTSACQALDGKTVDAAIVRASVANGLETFTFTLDTTLVPGGLAHFRWAALGQSPGSPPASGPWDYLPNATNPDSGAANPGDRRCDSAKSGVRLRMTGGVEVGGANTPPTAKVQTGRCSASNTRSALVNVTLGDKDGDPLTLALTSNSNPQLVPSGTIVVGGSGLKRTITFTAASTKSGRAALGFTASDGTAPVNFVLTAIVGTNNAETLTGTKGADVLLGLGGRNTINGDDGNDLLCGDAMSDVLHGGAGNDTLTGRGAADMFSGGPGTDVATDFDVSAGDTNDGTIP